ncbi:hypothetical protein E3T39_02055 [Cryobacterium suzukii]|uniref:Uncharacterized protein n=1 Tax=Cryobacterium suzukii TaxID=1259198 RepID=A0A4R9AJB5_9MICO|nr:hypothetical protein [Cryobacterium suzukii]TFD62742.1 hypothetical protein E3T39_02055 [Cryobacterium suzukii]
MSSQIQQRMAIERIRTSAVLWLVFGGVSTLLAISQVAASFGSGERRMIIILNVAIAAGWVILGLFNLRRYRREIKAFTTEHGVDAGIRYK